MEKIFITFYFGAFELNVFGILGYSSHTWTFQCRVLSVFTLSKERDLPRCGNEFRDEKQTQKKVDMSNLPAVFFGGEQWSSKTPMWHSIFLDGLLISMACKESPKKKTGERVFDGFENIPDVLQQLDQAFGEYCSPIAKCKIRSYPILEGFFRYPNRSKLLQMIRVGLSFKSFKPVGGWDLRTNPSQVLGWSSKQTFYVIASKCINIVHSNPFFNHKSLPCNMGLATFKKTLG